VVAALVCGDAYDLSNERLCELTELRSLMGRRSQRAAVASHVVFAITHFQLGEPPELVENLDRRREADLQVLVGLHSFGCEATTRSAQELLSLFCAELVFHRMGQLKENGDVRLREERVCLCGQLVGEGRLALATPCPPLLDESIALQGRQVGADRVIGQAQGSSQLIYCLARATEQ